MRNYWIFVVVIVALLTSGCSRPNPFEADVSSVPAPPLKIKRYEQALFDVPADSFFSYVQRYQPEFPLFLGGDLTDTNAVLQLKSFFTDPYMRELYDDVMKEYPNLSAEEDALRDAIRHWQYYFPLVKTPEVYTYVSGLDFEFPVKYANDNLVIALDMYLGPDTKAYKTSGFPRYLSRWYIRQSIIPDICREMASGLMEPLPKTAPMLDRMINEGKKLYLTHLMMPEIADTLLFKYTAVQMQWVKDYEPNIWAFLLENQLLYSKDKSTQKKFFDDAPFTDLFSKTSPSRLGSYIGYRIIYSLMTETGMTPEEMMRMTDAQKILKLSRYKPEI